MKKTFNWLGWLIVFLYIAIAAVLYYLSIYLRHIELISASNTLHSIAVIMNPVGLATLPVLYNWSLGKILPYQKAFATVILPEVSTSRIHHKTGTRTHVDYYVTFELSNGNRLVFMVPPNIYYTLLRGERGTLTYKAQGKHTYFVDFKRQY